MSNTNITDLEYIRESAFGKDEFVKDMINLFLQEVPESIAQVKKSVEKEDWQALQKEIHKLRPNLTAFGIKKLDARLEGVQRAGADNQRHPDLENILSELYETVDTAVDELQTEKQKL